jgi:hypothetical protein
MHNYQKISSHRCNSLCDMLYHHSQLVKKRGDELDLAQVAYRHNDLL